MPPMTMMIRIATTIATHVRFFLVSAIIQPSALSYRLSSFHEAPGFVGPRRVIIALAERNGGLKFLLRGRTVSSLQRQPSELQVRPPLHPFPPLDRQRAGEVLARIGVPANRCPRGAALVVPQRRFAEHVRARVA